MPRRMLPSKCSLRGDAPRTPVLLQDRRRLAGKAAVEVRAPGHDAALLAAQRHVDPRFTRIGQRRGVHVALLAALAHEQGKAILLSTHDISRSLMLTDQLWVITRDRQVLTGATPEMVRSQAMNQVFANPSITFNPTHCDYESTPPE